MGSPILRLTVDVEQKRTPVLLGLLDRVHQQSREPPPLVTGARERLGDEREELEDVHDAAGGVRAETDEQVGASRQLCLVWDTVLGGASDGVCVLRGSEGCRATDPQRTNLNMTGYIPRGRRPSRARRRWRSTDRRSSGARRLPVPRRGCRPRRAGRRGTPRAARRALPWHQGVVWGGVLGVRGELGGAGEWEEVDVVARCCCCRCGRAGVRVGHGYGLEGVGAWAGH